MRKAMNNEKRQTIRVGKIRGLEGHYDEARLDRFTIEHVHAETEKLFGEVVAAFQARLGKFDPAIFDRLRDGEAPDAIRARLEGMVGSSGFMLFWASDHGAFLRLAGQTKKAIQ